MYILTTKPKILFQIIPNADFVKPRIDGSHGSKIFIPGRDDAAEFDDTAVTAELKGLVDDEVKFIQMYLSLWPLAKCVVVRGPWCLKL